MRYDLLIKNGTLIDGSGQPRYRADVAVRNGRIVATGKIKDPARKVIDAEGQVVAPGFIDGHTHMDAQIFWDPLGTCSCYHGVTSVVMGNCGFSLAPCAESAKHLVVRNLQRAEDISLAAMEAGIRWSWTTFAEFLDRIDALPKGINYSSYIGHSALRTHVMGERAFEQAASEDEVRAMERELRAAITAGAIGFTTSRSPLHETPDAKPVASRLASWDEIRRLVGVMGELNAGIFEIAAEGVARSLDDPAALRDYHVRMRDLAVETRRPVTWGIFDRLSAPGVFRKFLALLDETAQAGGQMFAQVHSRGLNVVLSFKSQLPFDDLPEWKPFRALPLSEQKRLLRDPATRARLIAGADDEPVRRALGTEARPFSYEWIFLYDKVAGPHRTIAQIASERGVPPAEAMIDLALERDFDCFFIHPVANELQDSVLEMMRHPRTVVTFSDAGAHVSQISDCSLQTHLLSHWVREKQAFTLEQAVRMITFVPATYWGFSDRGLVREGFAADLVVFDPNTIAPEMPQVVNDLPAGARRLLQRARGISATVVNGQILLRDGKPTGALPGRLLRGPLAAQCGPQSMAA
jgi:N-acyl-D-aspartate/D-glutamate deacylase